MVTDPPGRRGRIRLQGRDFGVRFGEPGADVDHFRRAQPAGLGFEQQVDGPFAGLMSPANGPAGLTHALMRPK